MAHQVEVDARGRREEIGEDGLLLSCRQRVEGSDRGISDLASQPGITLNK